MATQWFYKLLGDEFGPCSAAELKEHVALGNIEQDSLVRKGHDGDWVSAWRVKGLFEELPRQRNSTAVPKPPRTVEPTHPPPPPPPPRRPPKPIPLEATSPSPTSLESQSEQPPPKVKKHRSKWLMLTLIVGVLVPTYSWMRNSGLRDKLGSCETYGVVEVDVYYDEFFTSNVVVFDLQDGGSSTARRIDPIHLFLQFCDKLDLYTVRRVILARHGRQVFYISSADLRPLSNSYAGGGRVWAFNNLPESVRTMSGLRAYDQWTGGWLGVLQKQTEDLNEFIRDWTGY